MAPYSPHIPPQIGRWFSRFGTLFEKHRVTLKIQNQKRHTSQEKFNDHRTLGAVLMTNFWKKNSFFHFQLPTNFALFFEFWILNFFCFKNLQYWVGFLGTCSRKLLLKRLQSHVVWIQRRSRREGFRFPSLAAYYFLMCYLHLVQIVLRSITHWWLANTRTNTKDRCSGYTFDCFLSILYTLIMYNHYIHVITCIRLQFLFPLISLSETLLQPLIRWRRSCRGLHSKNGESLVHRCITL